MRQCNYAMKIVYSLYKVCSEDVVRNFTKHIWTLDS